MTRHWLERSWPLLFGIGLVAACRFASSLDGYAGDRPERWHGSAGQESDAASDVPNDTSRREDSPADAILDEPMGLDVKPEAADCPDGKGDCDALPGCETDLSLDSIHCGSCERSCYGGECSDGVCHPVALAIAQPKPWGVAADSTGVYWSIQPNTPAMDSRTIRFLASGALAPSEVVQAAELIPDFVVNTSIVYWIDARDALVVRIDNDGTNQSDVTAGSAPSSLATDGTWVFWTDAYPHSCAVCKAKTDGTSVSGLVGSSPGATGITLDDTKAYWFEEHSTTWQLMSISKNMGLPSIVSKSLRSPTALLVTDAFIFWTEAGPNVAYQMQSGAKVPICKTADGTLKKLDKGASSPTVVASGLKCPFRMVVAGTDLYWTNAGTEDGIGSVMKVGLNAGELSVVAENQPVPRGIAADASSVYWANEGNTSNDGTIMRVAW